jgi:hypothetical protein
MDKDATAHDEWGPTKTIALYPEPPKQKELASSAMGTRQLMRYRGPDELDAAIELHRRFALPLACLVLALVGIPLGVATRKGGRSAGTSTQSFWRRLLARQVESGEAASCRLRSRLAARPGFGVAGVILLIRMERLGDRTLGRIGGAFSALFEKMKATGVDGRAPADRRLADAPLPQIVDTYVLPALFYMTVTPGVCLDDPGLLLLRAHR